MGGYRPPLLESIPAPAPLTESDIRVQPAAPPSPKSERGIGYMGSGGKSAAMASNFLTGWLESMRAQEIRKAQMANRAVDFARQGYAGARKSFEEFSTRDDVRKAADKYADWVRSNANVSEEEFFARGGEQAQPPLEAREANLLQELGQRKAAAESAKHMYANVLQQFVMPEPGAKGKKGKEGGVRGIPIIGNIVQALAPNIDPQMVPAAMVEMVRGEEIRAPELSTEERYQQTRLAEFQKEAPLRERERKGREAELDVDEQARTLRSQMADAIKKGDRESEERIYGQIKALKGERVGAAEQLGEEMARTGLSVLDKVKRGVKPDQFTDAEKAWYQRTLQYQPTNIEQAIVSKIGMTVNGRAFTLDDAINEVVRANARIAAAGRQPSAFAQQLEFYRDAEAFTQFQRSYGQLDQGQRGKVDMAVATRMKSTAEERRPELSPEQKRAIPYNVLKAMTSDPKFGTFIKEQKDKEGKAAFPKILSPGEATGWFGKSTQELAVDYGEFITAWEQKLKDAGLSDAEANSIVAPYRRAQMHTPTAGTSPNMVRYRMSDGRTVRVAVSDLQEFLRRDPDAVKLP